MARIIAKLSTIRFDGIGRLQRGEGPASYTLVACKDPGVEPFKDASQYLQSRIDDNSITLDFVESLEVGKSIAQGRCTAKSDYCQVNLLSSCPTYYERYSSPTIPIVVCQYKSTKCDRR
jgi:hypothetical protein